MRIVFEDGPVMSEKLVLEVCQRSVLPVGGRHVISFQTRSLAHWPFPSAILRISFSEFCSYQKMTCADLSVEMSNQVSCHHESTVVE